MNKELTKDQKELLTQAHQISAMVKSKGWELFRKFLEDKINHSWLDPQGCSSEQELSYKYTIAWGQAKAAQEILDWIDNMIDAEKTLLKKEKGEDKVYRVGGE